MAPPMLMTPHQTNKRRHNLHDSVSSRKYPGVDCSDSMQKIVVRTNTLCYEHYETRTTNSSNQNSKLPRYLLLSADFEISQLIFLREHPHARYTAIDINSLSSYLQYAGGRANSVSSSKSAPRSSLCAAYGSALPVSLQRDHLYCTRS